MRLITLGETDLVRRDVRTVMVHHINLDCVTHLSHVHYNPTPNDPQARDAWHVSMGDPSVSFEITQEAFEKIKRAMMT